jgi:hypothetical protein
MKILLSTPPFPPIESVVGDGRGTVGRVGEQAAEGWGKALTQLVRYLNNKEDIWN